MRYFGKTGLSQGAHASQRIVPVLSPPLARTLFLRFFAKLSVVLFLSVSATVWAQVGTTNAKSDSLPVKQAAPTAKARSAPNAIGQAKDASSAPQIVTRSGGDSGVDDAPDGRSQEDSGSGEPSSDKQGLGKKKLGGADLLEASVSATKIEIGDEIIVHFSVIHDATASISLPVDLKLGAFIERTRKIAHDTEPEISPDIGASVVTLSLTVFEFGTHTLPSIRVNIVGATGEISQKHTAPVSIEVIENISAEDPSVVEVEGELQMISLREKTYSRVIFLSVLFGGLLVFLLGALTYRKLKQRADRRVVSVPRVPCHIQAIRDLSAIDVEEMLSGSMTPSAAFSEGEEAVDNSQRVVMAHSRVLRWFLGQRWGFDSLELTKKELLKALATELDVTTFQFVRETLDGLDYVKFAGAEAQADKLRDQHRQLHRFFENNPEPIIEQSEVADDLSPNVGQKSVEPNDASQKTVGQKQSEKSANSSGDG